MTNEKINEQMIEQFAEIRAAQCVTNFMLIGFLEQNGADSGRLLEIVDSMIKGVADKIENDLRAKAGLPDRPEPRRSVFGPDGMGGFDWSKMDLN